MSGLNKRKSPNYWTKQLVIEEVVNFLDNYHEFSSKMVMSNNASLGGAIIRPNGAVHSLLHSKASTRDCHLYVMQEVMKQRPNAYITYSKRGRPILKTRSE